MIRYILIGLLLCGQAISFAQIIYHDASNFPLLGKAKKLIVHDTKGFQIH